VSIVLVSACARGKGPAEIAIKGAEEAITTLKAEAVKYIPDEVRSLEGALAAAKDKFAKGDYKAATSEAQAIVDKAKGLVEVAKSKKEELARIWGTLSAGVPKMLAAVQSRVDILSKSKKLPANVTAEKLAEAKSGLAAAKDEWGKALASSTAGNAADAVSLANAVKGKAAKAMELLELPVPAGAK
jgi:hypothetical protein